LKIPRIPNGAKPPPLTAESVAAAPPPTLPADAGAIVRFRTSPLAKPATMMKSTKAMCKTVITKLKVELFFVLKKEKKQQQTNKRVRESRRRKQKSYQNFGSLLC
jgi:hypothetical protein